MTKKIELKDSGVVFLPKPHEYWLGDKQLNGITGMLHRQLFPDEFDGIPMANINKAADYGTSVHASIEDFDKNWINDGTQEVADYINICHEYGFVHEASEYTITDGTNWASNIDKVYRVSDETFSLGDIKTFGNLTSQKIDKTRWQLSIYAYLFELQNKKAHVDKLFIIHIRNKAKKDGGFDHISEVVFVDRIPSDICKDLLDTDLRGEQFQNPFSIPEKIKNQEAEIRQLIETKKETEEKLAEIKANILADMEISGVKTWATDTMRLTRKMPTTRTSININQLRKDHPEIDYSLYAKTSNVAGSLLIAV